MAGLTQRRVKYRVKLEEPITQEPVYLWLNQKLEVMVVETKRGLKVFGSVCPHMGAQLRWNSKNDTTSCPWHGLTFDCQTLESCHPRYRRMTEFSGEVIDGELVIYEAST